MKYVVAALWLCVVVLALTCINLSRRVQQLEDDLNKAEINIIETMYQHLEYDHK